MPHAVPVQPIPLTLQVAAVFDVPLMRAVNCWLLPTITRADVGEMVSETGPEMVTWAVPDFNGSATDVALTVTCACAGVDAGAVNRPVVEIVPHAVPVQPAPLTLHVTAVLDVPVTVALNCWRDPTRTFAVAGETASLDRRNDSNLGSGRARGICYRRCGNRNLRRIRHRRWRRIEAAGRDGSASRTATLGPNHTPSDPGVRCAGNTHPELLLRAG